jgi:hypothetical protein
VAIRLHQGVLLCRKEKQWRSQGCATAQSVKEPTFKLSEGKENRQGCLSRSIKTRKNQLEKVGFSEGQLVKNTFLPS